MNELEFKTEDDYRAAMREMIAIKERKGTMPSDDLRLTMFVSEEDEEELRAELDAQGVRYEAVTQ